VPRTAVAIGLSGSDMSAVFDDLLAAGYEPIHAETPDDLERLLSLRSDIKVAVIDGEVDFDRTLEMYSALHEIGRNVPALLLVPAFTLGRMNLGGRKDSADEYFSRPFTGESLRYRLDALLIRSGTAPVEAPVVVEEVVAAQHVVAAQVQAAVLAPDVADYDVSDEPRQRGRLVIVFNPKGGVGKTTVSINLGAALTIHKKMHVLLVDCDAVTGHVAPSLGMPQLRTLAEAWLWDEQEGIHETVAQIATQHQSGMDILVLAGTPFHTEILVPGRVARAIAEARNSYDFVILDLHPDFGPLNLALFALADRIIVPVTPDVPCIRAAMQFREVATALDLRHRLLMVINRANSGVPTSQVEKTLDIPTLARIRSAGPVFFESSDSGKSAVERYPNDKAIGDMFELTDNLLDILNAGDGRPTQSKGGFLGLFGRRGRG